MIFCFSQEEVSELVRQAMAHANDPEQAIVIPPENIKYECEYCKWNVEGVCINSMSAGFDVKPDHFCSCSAKED